MQQDFLDKLDYLLTDEEGLVEALKNTRAASRLSASRKQLLNHLRELAQGGDLSLIIKTEKKIIQGDLSRYANSAAMVTSLKAALEAMHVIEHHLTLVASTEKYRIVDQSHSLAKNRKAGLPFDEARQALADAERLIAAIQAKGARLAGCSASQVKRIWALEKANPRG